MVKLGIENQTAGNPYILSYNGCNDTISSGEKLEDKITRLSFTCNNLKELKTFLQDMPNKIAKLFSSSYFILTGWNEKNPMFTPTRSLLLKRKYEKYSFLFKSTGDYWLGTSPLNPVIDTFLYDQIAGRKDYIIFSQYAKKSDEQFLYSLIKSSSRCYTMLNTEGPSITDTQYFACAYVAYDDNIRPGIITVINQEINIQDLNKVGLKVEEILLGPEAYKVWQQ